MASISGYAVYVRLSSGSVPQDSSSSRCQEETGHGEESLRGMQQQDRRARDAGVFGR